MKVYGAIFTILVVVSIAVFGFVTMNHSANHAHNGCIATANSTIDCSGVFAKIADFISLHASAFRTFTSATFGSSAVAILLLFMAFAMVALFSFTPPFNNKNTKKEVFCASLHFFAPVQLALTRWTALHENSPSYY